MSMYHSFDIEIAEKIGLENAIVLEQIRTEIGYYKSSKQNFHNGKYWSCNTGTAVQSMFPYWNIEKICQTLKNLRDVGLIEGYRSFENDKFLYYHTLTEKGISLIGGAVNE